MKHLGKIDVAVKLEELAYEPPASFFERETEGGEHLGMLIESRRKELAYGARTIAVTKPGLQFIGKGRTFEIIGLNEAGISVLGAIAEGLEGAEGVKVDCLDDKIAGTIERRQMTLPEHLRIRQPGLGSVLRQLLSTFSIDDPDAGLYGAFAYDYVRQAEDIGKRFATGGGADVNLLLPFELVAFDELRGIAVRKTYKFGSVEAEAAVSRLSYGKKQGTSTDMTDGQYLKAVEKIISEIRAGEMIQAILSKTVKTGLSSSRRSKQHCSTTAAKPQTLRVEPQRNPSVVYKRLGLFKFSLQYLVRAVELLERFRASCGHVGVQALS